jgi:uncharacterized protein
MSAWRNSVTRNQLLLFVVLAYALSWWAVPFAQGGLIPHGPALAAIIIIGLAEGRHGLRRFWRRCTNWRAGWWYLIGPAVIVAYLLVAYLINELLGATVTTPPQLPSASVLLNLLLLGGLWEEPGWTGYALPALQERFGHRRNGVLIATLLLGIVRAFWHLPLVLSGAIPWYDAVFYSLALQVIISWVYNRSNGSVPAVMVTHFTSNVLGGATMLVVFSGSERAMYYVLFVICACLIALAILWHSQFRLGYREILVRTGDWQG